MESTVAARPTTEQCAREILAIFVSHYGLRPGDVLRRNNFDTLWSRRGYSPVEFRNGLKLAMENGWLELLPGSESYRLTKIGFKDG
jgi:hypothetical protein